MSPTASDFDSLHITPLGSGSHSPFPVQVAELGPVSSNPARQLNLIVLPSTGIYVMGAHNSWDRIGTTCAVHTGINSGCPHLAIC